MAGKHFNIKQKQNLLIRADRLIGQGLRLCEICEFLGISKSSFYRWQRDFGVTPDNARLRIMELSRQVETLHRQLAEAETDLGVMRLAAEGN